MRISRDTLRRTRKEEGWVPKPYTGPQGYRLVGFGHSIETGPKFDFLEGRDWDSAPLTEDEGEKVLSGDLEVIGRELEHHWPAVKDIPEEAQQVMLRVAFQLGVGTLMKFRKMKSALERGHFAAAADEMLDSRWARQTPNRANREAEVIRGIIA